MKNILISIQPKWVAKILNGEKTIEIRKIFPKEYRGWVYIYCTKGKPYLANGYELFKNKYSCLISDEDIYKEHKLNGKVVARFYCDNVEDFYDFDDDLCKLSCVDRGQILNYLGNNKGYAIHISQLEIFDKPKELSEFYIRYPKGDIPIDIKELKGQKFMAMKRLEKAPQSYMHIEVEE